MHAVKQIEVGNGAASTRVVIAALLIGGALAMPQTGAASGLVQVASADTPATSPQAQCTVVSSADRFDRPLSRVARHLNSGRPLKIVAIGSSSTAGAGASSPAASYPSRLADDLTAYFPGHPITVLNRGVNGEEAPDMLARFDSSVISERPDLVIWQVGTNWVLRDHPLDPHATVLRQGVARLKAAATDIVMLDPQFTPKVIVKPETDAMVAQIAATAKEENIDLFRRYSLMKRWFEVDHLPFEAFTSPDGLHMNDWSYACLAKWIAVAIEEAATRPTAVARRPLVH
jgi:acyl-CoA thioesterase I